MIAITTSKSINARECVLMTIIREKRGENDQ